MTREPGRFAVLLLKKAGLLLWPREVHDIFSLSAEARAYVPLLNLFFVGFGILLPLFCAGAAKALGDPGLRRAPVFLHFLAALGVCATLMVFFVNSRYRLLLLPCMAPLAGFGAASLIQWLRERRWLPAAVTLAALVLGAGIQWAPAASPGAGFRASQAKALAQSGHPEEALFILTDLVREHPQDGDAANSLTVLLLWQGELDRAEQQARRLSGLPGFAETGGHYLWLIGRVREGFAPMGQGRRIIPSEDYHAFLDQSAEAYFQQKRTQGAPDSPGSGE